MCACWGLAAPATLRAAPLFSAPFLSYDTGYNPVGVVAADLDGDGRPDLAVLNSWNRTVAVLPGNGDGTLGARTDYGLGLCDHYSLAAGDLNGDGRPDLVVANYCYNTVSVMLADGSGGFGAMTDFATGAGPYCVAIGDLNGDGRSDVAVVNASANTVSVLLGTGTGSLAPHVDYATGSGPQTVALGDLNGDGRPDLAVACYTANAVSVLLGSGTGTFAAHADYATGNGSWGVAIGDLSGDGRADLAVTNVPANTVSVLLGNGTGAFGTRTDYATGSGPLTVAIGDVSGDGRPDLVTVDYYANTVSVLLGSGAGAFGAKADFVTGTLPRALCLADMNGDSRLDLCVPNFDSRSVAVLLGQGDGSFGPMTYPTGNNPYAVAVGDLDGDGHADMAVANYGSNTVSVRLANPAGAFGPKTDYATGANPRSIAAGDLDGDGDVDLVTANYNSGTVSVLLGRGDGTFGAKTDFYAGVIPSSVAIGDLNGDGKPDLAVPSFRGGPGGGYGNTVALLFGAGDGTFGGRIEYAALSYPSSVAIGDLNGDGFPDLALVGDGSGVVVRFGAADGTFNTSASFATATGTSAVAIGDLNGDGRRDLAIACGSGISVLIGTGGGAFAAHVDYVGGYSPFAIAIGDLNGDGKPDLAAANQYSNSVTVLPGNGDGSFGAKLDFGTGTQPYGLAIGELNGDGKPDVAVANYGSNMVSLLLSGPAGAGNVVAPLPAATCITPAHACVTIPVTITRSDAAPVRGFSVSLSLGSNLSLCGAGIAQGSYLGAGETHFEVVDGGGGNYTVDAAILGPSCGATAPVGTLFELHLGSSAPSGTGTVAVTAVTLRDCDNHDLATATGNPVNVTIDQVSPAAMTDLAAAQQKSGNGHTSGTTNLMLSFTAPGDAAAVEVYRAPFGGTGALPLGTYPEYTGGAPAAPAYPPPAPWALTAVHASGAQDNPGARGFWYYVAFSKDACGNVSAVSNVTSGRLDYFLGDIADGVTACTGNNLVDGADLSALGSHYGISLAPADALACLDVGPTTDGSVNARPVPDDRIDFEDLMLYSIDFGTVSAPQFTAAPAASGGGVLGLDAPAHVQAGQVFGVALRLRAGGGVHGLSSQLAWDGAVAEPVAIEAGDLLAAQDGVVFSARPGNVDCALLGPGRVFAGEGVVATVTFRALSSGDPNVSLASVDTRDASNRTLAPGTLGRSSPVATAFAPVSPNPFSRTTNLTFSLARAGEVTLAVYGVDGRRVTTLASGPHEAGTYSIGWDGRDASGRALRSGLYYARLATPAGHFARTLVLIQ